MPILNIEHDFGHAIEADPNWSESYYFNGYAPAPRVGFFARIAIRPNEPHADGFICVWLPDGTQVRLSAACANDIPDPGQPTLEGIRFERLMPMQVWRLVGDGRAEDGRGVAIDVTFQALTPAIGIDATKRHYAGANSTAVQSLASGHFEQAGRWDGVATVEGVRYAIVGHGNRDKSWGPRRTDGARGMQYWRWFSMNFGADLHLGGIRIGTESGTLERGWLYRAGASVGLRALAVTTEVSPRDFAQRRVKLVARDKHGATHEFSGEVFNAMPLRARGHDHMLIIEGLTQWTHAGRTGYGICEYAHCLTPNGEPLVRIT